MNDIFLSIIIPVYQPNINEFKRCVHSISSLSIPLEVLIINDGSTGEVIEECKSLIQNYEYIQWIDANHGGVSNARNVGIVKAQGDYLLFVDLDDYITSEFVDYLHENYQSISDDWVLFNYYEHFKLTGKTYKRILFDDNAKVQFEDVLQLLVQTKMLNACWGKLVKRSLVVENNIRFPINVFEGEDKMFNLYLLEYVNTVRFVPIFSYVYLALPRKTIRVTNNPIIYFDNFANCEIKINDIIEKRSSDENRHLNLVSHKCLNIELMVQDLLVLVKEKRFDQTIKAYFLNMVKENKFLEGAHMKDCPNLKVKIYYLILKYHLWFNLKLIVILKKLLRRH